jgi:hypothetical protein
MNKVKQIAYEIAESFVWNGFREKKHIEFYGVGAFKRKGEIILSIYLDEKFFNYEHYINQLFQKFYKNVKVKITFCEKFIPYVNLSVGDKVRHKKLRGWGTLGGFCKELGTSYKLAISNNHVFANSNNAQLGDPLEKYPNQIFGELYKFIPLKPYPNINSADVAVGIIYEEYKLDWINRKPKGIGKPRRNMLVYKYGARTGYTEGIIENTGSPFIVNYGHHLGELNFKDCIVIRGINGPFALPGDSGSLVIAKKSNKVVGMIFSGEGRGERCLANPFSYIAKKLKIDLL